MTKTQSRIEIFVQFEHDYIGDHMCKQEDIIAKSIIAFDDEIDAIHFIAECTSCSHNLKDVAPELFYWENPIDTPEVTNKELEEFINKNNY